MCGHTHRIGLQHETSGMYGKTSTLYGLEVGHMMDMSQAHYLTSGSANWHHGIGILVETNRKVIPFAVPIVNGEVRIP